MDAAIVRFSLYKLGAVPPRTKCSKCGEINTTDKRIVLVQICIDPDMWEVECKPCNLLEDKKW